MFRIMRRPGWWFIGPWPTAGFSLALFFLVGVGIVSQLGTLHLTQTGHWVVHTHEVLRAIEEAVSAVREADTLRVEGQNQAVSHPEWRGIEQRVFAAMLHLRLITADNPREQERASRLESLVHRRFTLLRESATGDRSPQFLAQMREITAAMSREADEMRHEEQNLLARRSGDFRGNVERTNGLIELGNLLALILVIGGLCLVNRSAGKRLSAEAALQDAHAGLEKRVTERTAELEAANAALQEEIAARRRTQERVSQLAALVESSDDSIIGLTLEGDILTWNAGAEKLHGRPASEVCGRPLAELIPADRPDELPGCLARIRRGEHVEPFETVRLRHDGTRVDVWQTISPIHDAEGRVVGASAVARDISERKRLEQQYRQAQKMEAVGRLAGGIAHDFNNLLTVISCCTEILRTRLGQHHDGLDLVEEIQRAGERAASLTRQLLAFSRRQVLQPRVVDLNGLLRDTEKMLCRLIGEDIDFVTALDPELHPVLVDPGQIEQVLLNLAVNARDAMPRGGRLTIETANVSLDQNYARARPEVRPGRYVMVAVTDTGCGMDAATRARIFEPFFTTKEAGKGTGLGLATVYGVIKQSGGFVYVQSEAGQGASFRIYLPPAATASGLSTTPAPRAAIRTTKPAEDVETVLLVEDEDSVRALTLSALQQHGYRVLEAADGRQALALAEEHVGPIHLLVSDVVMPQMGGREVADQLATLHPETRVLFMSGYTSDEILRHGVQEAEVPFLSKPFTPEALARKVRDVLHSNHFTVCAS